MKFNVIEEKENPLLKRREILFSLDYEGGSTPNKADLQKLFSENLKSDIKRTEIKKVLSEIGKAKGKAWVYIWEDKEIPIYSESKKKEEKPVEEKPPEKPKEEKKEKEPVKEEEKKEKVEKPKEEKVEEGEVSGKKEESKGKERKETKEQEQAQKSSDMEKV